MSDVPDKDVLFKKIDMYCKANQYHKALNCERRLIDYYDQDHKLFEIIKWITFTEQQLDDLRGREDASSLFFLAYLTYFGRGGVAEDEAAGYAYWCRAAEMGHVFSLYWKGFCLSNGSGVARDGAAAFQCYRDAADRGCGEACGEAGNSLENGWGVERDLQMAAVYYQKGSVLGESSSTHQLGYMLRKYPLECAPFGRWVPDSLCFQLFPQTVRAAMQYWLLIAHRLDLSRDIRHIICSIICTRNGW